MTTVFGLQVTVPTRAKVARARGFTLVELMVVCAILGTVGAMGTTMYRRAVSGASGPAFARSLVTLVHEARHAAMTTGRPSRIRIVPPLSAAQPATVIVSEVLDPADATKSNWITNTSTSVPLRMEFCQPAAGVILATAPTPTCPITTGMNTIVCIAANGRTSLAATGGICPGTGSATANQPATGNGATIFFRGTQQLNNDVRYKIVVWGLTGLPKLVDRW